MLLTAANAWSEQQSGTGLQQDFAREVDKQLIVPAGEQDAYAQRLDIALIAAGKRELASQFVLLVDRNPFAQIIMIYWRSPQATSHFVGATPVSTGRPGSYEHFATPLGVFEHSLDNPDFRAEGTPNELGVRGYGARGMRVYDFGWVRTQRGWGKPGESVMRLQMHSTDPVLLEPRLGTPASKGCIRIPATLNRFIDHYGLLDADYEEALKRGQHLWVLPDNREPTPWAGRYLVVIDVMRTARPAWMTPSGAGGRASEPAGCKP